MWTDSYPSSVIRQPFTIPSSAPSSSMLVTFGPLPMAKSVEFRNRILWVEIFHGHMIGRRRPKCGNQYLQFFPNDLPRTYHKICSLAPIDWLDDYHVCKRPRCSAHGCIFNICTKKLKCVSKSVTARHDDEGYRYLTSAGRL